MLLMSFFALISVDLDAAGVYGVSAYSVSQRRTEFGVRIAIGASPNDLIRLVLRRTIRPISFGITFGLTAAFVLARFLESQLYGITPRNPTVYTAVLLFLASVSLLHTFPLARRHEEIRFWHYGASSFS